MPVMPGEHRPQRGGEPAPLLVERDVGAPGVPAGAAPLRLAVAHEHDTFGHRRVTATPALRVVIGT